MYSFDEVLNYDPELAKAMDDELARQRSHIELIASENLVSKAVMAAMGSPLTNKYAEGYPGKRYYGGCEYVDVVETLAKPIDIKIIATIIALFFFINCTHHSFIAHLLYLNYTIYLL